MDTQGDSGRDAGEPKGSNADAEDSAAHIAELVRRTTERRAAPGPSVVAGPEATLAQPTPMPAPSVAPPTTPISAPSVPQARPTMSTPSRRTLVVAGAVVAVLIAGGVALSQTFDSDVGTGPKPTAPSSVPAGYTVKVSDVITDCAGHSRGRVKVTFGTQKCVKATRSLATGQISGRPALFVVSRIQMATAESAAAVKQVLDGSGTGNLNDLLREGKTFAGAPAKMPVSGYASVQTGPLVTVVEAGFVDSGRSSNSDAALRAAAAQVAAKVNTEN